MVAVSARRRGVSEKEKRVRKIRSAYESGANGLGVSRLHMGHDFTDLAQRSLRGDPHARLPLLCALLGSLLAVAYPGQGFAQSISNVSVSSKSGAQGQTSEFTLKITGKEFGSDASKVSVLVSPGKLSAAVGSLSTDGKVLTATFTAAADYDPGTVSVTANGTASEPYVISRAAEQSDLQKYVRVYRTLIDPKVVADVFGRRIAKRFVVLQVTVTNRNKDYELLIHDLSLDLKGLAIGKAFGKRQEVSSVELSLLRGVAERGQSDDPRNRFLRVLRGAGTVAAGLIGVAKFGKSYAPSVAVWSGPVVTAFSDIFPDATINQMNRLSDSAYSANSIVPKQHSKVMAVFLPQAILLNPEQRKEFWKDPTSLPDDFNLRAIALYVDGNFITNVEDLEPTLTAAQIDASEMKNFQTDKAEVKGSVSGKYLSGTDIKLMNNDLPGVTIRLDGTPTDQKLDFVVDSNLPVPPGKVLKFGVSKKGQDTVKETYLAIQYSPAVPTLSRVDPSTVSQGDQDKVLTLTGTNLLPGATQLVIAPGNDVNVTSIDVKSSTSLEAKVSVTAAAAASSRQLTVVTGGGSSSGLPFAINKKP